jgi:drug/metabolite transporter (DMT)-like permease
MKGLSARSAGDASTLGESSRLAVFASFAAIYFLYGGTYLAIALGLRSIPPFLLMGSRSILGGAVLLLISRIQGPKLRPAEDWLHAAISGMLLFLGCHGALAYAERFVPSGISAVVLATIPFWIILVNLAIGRREPWQELAGLVPGFLGVTIIALLGSPKGNQPVPPAMIALLLGSSLSWALGTVYVQNRAIHIPSHDLAGMQLICGGAGLLALSLASGELTHFNPQKVTAISLLGMLYLALLGSALGNTAYLWLLDRMPAPIVATYTFVNPVVALILGWWLLGERISLISGLGIALVIGSVILLQLFKARSNSRFGQTPNNASDDNRTPSERASVRSGAQGRTNDR